MESKFIKIFFTLFLSALVLIGGFNWLIDPYAIFNSPLMQGVNERKTEATTRQRLSKAYEVIRKKPATLVMGDSRALALATEHPSWKNRPAFQYALTSASIYEVLRYFQHATSTKSVREAVIELNIGMFLPGSGHPQNFDNGRLAVDIDGRPTNSARRLASYLNDAMPALLSLSALKSSIQTIERQNDINAEFENGKEVVCQNPDWQHSRIRAKGGSYEFLLQIPREFLLKNLQGSKNSPATSVVSIKDHWNGYAYFETLIRYAYDHNVKLYLYIAPTHALLEESWHMTGFDKEIEDWLEKIVHINEKVASEKGRQPFPMWDFSGYNSINTEPLPPDGDLDTPMKWFWEAVHVKRETAHFIIDRLFDYHRKACPVPADFGVRITSENINKHIEEKQKQRAEYIKHNSEFLDIIKKEFRKVKIRGAVSNNE